ncbi:class E sortase [Streptomyces sp. MUM 203J]|uniref:class E sortase n=1 Tax=Streptomyces sp. MUM 203J TaxID=2791990 RepID=UPI001F037E1C|nr:class E sortase [Streptomyces sp. MUM 203J]MCH0538747.1 class E sortase [Streptomyces sp. MUM 203J]
MPETPQEPYGGREPSGGQRGYEGQEGDDGYGTPQTAPPPQPPEPQPYDPYAAPQGHQQYQQPYGPAPVAEPYPPQPYQPEGHGGTETYRPEPYPAEPYPSETYGTETTYGGSGYATEVPVRHDGTVPMPVVEPPRIADGQPAAGEAEPYGPEPSVGGRAERRRAAKSGGRRRNVPMPVSAAASAGSASEAPMTRLEARRAARAAKDGFGVIASRAVGEIFITFGVLMLLFVVYQLVWTNVQAGLEAGKEKDRITENWANGDGKEQKAFAPGQGFAILHIPKLDVVVPVAEGIDKERVLDKGMVGHYGEGTLKTAMPSDKEGNFAVAGHRNTHGEPFRYINQLRPGDPIVVETRDRYYVYEMASILPQTPPSNVSVLKPVPDGSGFTEPGRYITLTTCTPEFTSTYRMIVWGKLVEEQPRDKGEPKALAG